ncbi:MAG: DinB family protein [Pirellulales bacterium]
MTLAQYIAQDLEREFAMTKAVLVAIPADKLAWKPHADLHTIGWNANHLADIAGWTPLILGASELDLSPPGAPPYAPTALTDPTAIATLFDTNGAGTLAALRDVAETTFEEPWSLKMGGHTIFTMKKGACLRKWVVSHLAHHRAILSADLRMAGVAQQSVFEIM